MDYFTEETSAKAVNARMGDAIDPRLKAIMTSLVRHLHAFAREVQLTQEEWETAIGFLTRTGQMCSGTRQEFILLSDVLGFSMLVDAINNRRPPGATENTVFGPFHVEGAPQRAMGESIVLDGKGETCLFRGRVTDLEGNPVEGARIDVWSDNAEGFYDVQQKGIQPDFNLRGVFRTGADGSYWFRAVRPKFYSVPTDGPVGKLLDDLGRHGNRPAHLHYIVSKDGFDEVTTHLFDPDDPYIDSDAVFGVKKSLIAEFNRVDDPARIAEVGFEGDHYWDVEFDFVLAPKG